MRSSGPNWSGDLPSGYDEIRAPTPMVWLLARVYVRDRADLPAARIYQNRLDVRPLSRLNETSFQSSYPRALPTAIERRTMIDALRKMGSTAFFERFMQLAAVNPPDPANAQFTQTVLVPLGLASAASSPASSIAASQRALLASGYDRVLARLGAPGAVQQRSRTANGWNLPGQAPPGSFGTNYLVRAIVAIWELAENPSADTIYFNASTDRNGARLDGSRRYSLTFAAGNTPPARAFWSVTVYDDRGRLITNPSGRYAVSSGENLVRKPDGALLISLQPDDPGPVQHSNWLPTSPGHTYELSLRCYWPDVALLDGRWTPPPVMPID